jgi:hypothetical protein
LSEENVWTSGQPLEHGTEMARYRVVGLAKGLLRVDQNAETCCRRAGTTHQRQCTKT